MGIIILISLILFELVFLVWNIAEKDFHQKEKAAAAIAVYLIFTVLCCTGVIEWGFRYIAIGIILAFQTVIAVTKVVKKSSEQTSENVIAMSIWKFTVKSLMYAAALVIAIICPQFSEPEPTGEYNVLEAKYTWTDESRAETFSDAGGSRKVTVRVWYPENCPERTPLVIFSHGAFGFSGSNYSTCTELASRGYTVAGIDHTYHSLFTADTDGNITIADTGFINDVMKNNTEDDPEKEFSDSHSWLELRVEDINFVINKIISLAETNDAVFTNTDTSKIGLIGHSLGGAAAAETARRRNDITSVVNLDGTLIGDELSETTNSDVPFPVPMLSIYSEYHYNKALEYEKTGSEYVNFHTERISDNITSTHFKNSGHLNFTDLPLFSPLLGKALGTMGTGDIDSLYCITTMNRLTADFFDITLKGAEIPVIEKEY